MEQYKVEGAYYESIIINELCYGPQESDPPPIDSHEKEVDRAHLCISNVSSGKTYDIEIGETKAPGIVRDDRTGCGRLLIVRNPLFKVSEIDNRHKITRVPRSCINSILELPSLILNEDAQIKSFDCPFFSLNNSKWKIKEKNFTDRV